MRGKEWLYLRLFLGTVFILVGFFWLGSEVVQWLHSGRWNSYSILDAIESVFPNASLKLTGWLYEPHSWVGLHKLLHGLIEFIYRVFLFTPFSALVILLGGCLCDACGQKLAKIKKDKELLGKAAKAKKGKTRSSSSPSGKKDERYYARTLGINEPVTVNDIKRRYKELVSQYHPDKVDHLGAELKKLAAQKTREINEAYAYFMKKYRTS
jgi:hypothetical protein